MAQRNVVLLTGGSGVVGSALRPFLAHHQVINLTHRARLDSVCVAGDLTQPHLGLDHDTYRKLISTVDTVVHCAAVTDFSARPEAADLINVAGTRGVLDFAVDAGARLIHVSTAFVARAELTRAAQGAEVRDAAARPENYLDSKRAAEKMLLDSGHPVVIARPSVVIGDSRSGRMTRFQGVSSVAEAVLRNRLPLVPFDPSSRVDVVPQDLLAAGLTALVDSQTSAGEYWLTAGENSLTAGRMVELCLEVADELGIEAARPRLVTPDMVDRLIRPVFIDPLPRIARRQFDDLMAMAALFDGSAPFPSSFGQSRPESLAVDLPGSEWFESAFRASVAYLAHTKGIVPADLSGVAV